MCLVTYYWLCRLPPFYEHENAGRQVMYAVEWDEIYLWFNCKVCIHFYTVGITSNCVFCLLFLNILVVIWEKEQKLVLCSNRVSKVYDILWDKEYLKNRINLCRGTKYRSKYGNHGYFSRSIDYRYDFP